MLKPAIHNEDLTLLNKVYHMTIYERQHSNNKKYTFVLSDMITVTKIICKS